MCKEGEENYSRLGALLTITLAGLMSLSFSLYPLCSICHTQPSPISSVSCWAMASWILGSNSSPASPTGVSPCFLRVSRKMFLVISTPSRRPLQASLSPACSRASSRLSTTGKRSSTTLAEANLQNSSFSRSSLLYLF